ncbi:MAG: hypothetical protein OEY28_04065, partial [Nitrospira sp.]|nr:hypothetical protein [Nitrospira sp.]
MNGDHTMWWKQIMAVWAIVGLISGLTLAPPGAYAGGTIKADEDKWISIGIGVRTSFGAVEGASPAGHYSNEFGIDNARIYINGKVHKNIGFEFNTECFNCA